jgi:cytosine/uracil/thiamine/allantoin permease
MSKKHENTKLDLVPRAIALAISLVITSIVAAGFASATDNLANYQSTPPVQISHS